MMTNLKEVKNDFPTELEDCLQDVHTAIVNVENALAPLLNCNLNDVKNKMKSLDRARLDLGLTYTLNSLFWIYLKTRGENPQENPVKQELERVKTYMARAKEIADKEKAPRLNTDATKRFVRNSLWEPTNQGKEDDNSESQDKSHSQAERTPKRRRMR